MGIGMASVVFVHACTYMCAHGGACFRQRLLSVASGCEHVNMLWHKWPAGRFTDALATHTLMSTNSASARAAHPLPAGARALTYVCIAHLYPNVCVQTLMRMRMRVTDSACTRSRV